MRPVQAHTLFFVYKNVVFPAQAEYFYFSADFRLKIFLYYSQIIAYEISVLEFIGGINYLTIGSCFSVHYRVMEHEGTLESTKEA